MSAPASKRAALDLVATIVAQVEARIERDNADPKVGAVHFPTTPSASADVGDRDGK